MNEYEINEQKKRSVHKNMCRKVGKILEFIIILYQFKFHSFPFSTSLLIKNEFEEAHT